MSTDKLDFITPKTNRTVAALKRTSSTAFGDSPFVIPPSPLMKRLGCGTYVTVYRYKRQKANRVNASPWAIKKAKKGHARKSIIERLTTEGRVLRELDHPNIVVFKKLTKTAQGDVCLSMEDCGKGLDDIIHKRQETDVVEMFTPTQIMKVTWYIANAIDYLHTTKKLLHGDIKSGNILIKRDFEQVKLCDFGVSIFLNDNLSGPRDPTATYVGSEPWNSKEVTQSNVITDKADVFAYGLVIWEMLSLDVPHVALMSYGEDSSLDGSFLESDDSYHIPQEYYDALGTRPALPEYEFSKDFDPAIGTFVCCTAEDYTKRPSARNIVESLTEIVKDFDIVLDLKSYAEPT